MIGNSEGNLRTLRGKHDWLEVTSIGNSPLATLIGCLEEGLHVSTQSSLDKLRAIAYDLVTDIA